MLISVLFCALLLLVQGDVVIVTSVQGYSDASCATVSGSDSGGIAVPDGNTCGATTFEGVVSVSGNTMTFQSCTSCSSNTTCGNTAGPAVTITNNACELISKFQAGATGSIKVSWRPAVVVSTQGYSDTTCGTASGSPTSAFIPTEGLICGSTSGLVGSATISGNTATVQGCNCASITSCGTTSGAPVTITNGACEPSSKVGSPGGSFRSSWSGGGSSAPCFHTDTVITYAGKDHTFDQIRAHPECSIPHVVSAHGVIVKAKCGVSEKTLRLTDGHLVYTQRGLQAAGDLKPGQDTVFADLAETTSCHVVSVTKESQQHDYFGLNCLNSQVLASGLKSSTFEKLHSIPAFWMQVIGRVLGVKRASQLGDYIGEIVQQMNLI